MKVTLQQSGYSGDEIVGTVELAGAPQVGDAVVNKDGVWTVKRRIWRDGTLTLLVMR